MYDERRPRAARHHLTADAPPIGEAELVAVRRDNGWPLERATVVFDLGHREVLLLGERWKHGRWTVAFDARFESGESTGDDRVDAQLCRRALRVLRVGDPVYAQLERLGGRTFELETWTA